MGHFYVALAGHSRRTLLSDTIVRHSCGAFLWDTFVGHSWWTLLCGTATEVSKNQPSHLKAGVLHKTSSKSHTSRLQNEHCARDCFQNSLVKSPKRAWRTRFSQKLILRVCITSVSYGMSSKSHASSHTSKSPNRAFRTRLPPKVKLGSPSEHAHIKQPCQAVSRFQPLQTMPAHTPIPMSQRHSPPPQLATLRFPAPATKIYLSTRPTRTKYCATKCHLRHTLQWNFP